MYFLPGDGGVPGSEFLNLAQEKRQRRERWLRGAVLVAAGALVAVLLVNVTYTGVM